MENFRIPPQACWMVRKILRERDMLHLVETEGAVKKSMIRQAYNQLLGTFPKVEWRGLMSRNAASPKTILTL